MWSKELMDPRLQYRHMQTFVGISRAPGQGQCVAIGNRTIVTTEMDPVEK